MGYRPLKHTHYRSAGRRDVGGKPQHPARYTLLLRYQFPRRERGADEDDCRIHSGIRHRARAEGYPRTCRWERPFSQSIRSRRRYRSCRPRRVRGVPVILRCRPMTLNKPSMSPYLISSLLGYRVSDRYPNHGTISIDGFVGSFTSIRSLRPIDGRSLSLFLLVRIQRSGIV